MLRTSCESLVLVAAALLVPTQIWATEPSGPHVHAHYYTKLQSQHSLAIYKRDLLIENHKNEFSFLKIKMNQDHGLVDIIYSENKY